MPGTVPYPGEGARNANRPSSSEKTTVKADECVIRWLRYHEQESIRDCGKRLPLSVALTVVLLVISRVWMVTRPCPPRGLDVEIRDSVAGIVGVFICIQIVFLLHIVWGQVRFWNIQST